MGGTGSGHRSRSGHRSGQVYRGPDPHPRLRLTEAALGAETCSVASGGFTPRGGSAGTLFRMRAPSTVLLGAKSESRGAPVLTDLTSTTHFMSLRAEPAWLDSVPPQAPDPALSSPQTGRRDWRPRLPAPSDREPFGAASGARGREDGRSPQVLRTDCTPYRRLGVSRPPALEAGLWDVTVAWNLLKAVCSAAMNVFWEITFISSDASAGAGTWASPSRVGLAQTPMLIETSGRAQAPGTVSRPPRVPESSTFTPAPLPFGDLCPVASDARRPLGPAPAGSALLLCVCVPPA